MIAVAPLNGAALQGARQSPTLKSMGGRGRPQNRTESMGNA
jgi:hypothetical protein